MKTERKATDMALHDKERSAEIDAQRHYARDLVGLDPDGAPCEACGRHMQDHEWADLDFWGIVVSCVFSPASTAGVDS